MIKGKTLLIGCGVFKAHSGSVACKRQGSPRLREDVPDGEHWTFALGTRSLCLRNMKA